MKLLDIANNLKHSAEAAHRQAEATASKAADRSRKVSYFKEFGNKWFSEVSEEATTLSRSFNEIAGDQATLQPHLNSDQGTYSIDISLFPQNLTSAGRDARCSIEQKPDDLKVLIHLFDGSDTSNLEFDVKIVDFAGFKVELIQKKEERVIDEKATDRYCDIDDENFFPIFKTVKSQETKLLTTNEFADFVLTQLVEHAGKPRRK
jgi:hypothetical protein